MEGEQCQGVLPKEASKEKRKRRSRKRKTAEGETSNIHSKEQKRLDKDAKVTRKEDRGKKKRPNVFTALQVTDESIVKNLQEVQRGALDSDSSLKEFFVSTNKAHVTLHAFYVAEDRLGAVENSLREAVNKWLQQKTDCKGELKLHFDGVGTFKDEGPTKVVFAKVAHSGILDKFYDSLTEDIMALELEGVSLSDSFQPHLTIMKLSRAKSSAGRKRKTIEKKHYAAFQDKDLGVQVCRSLQLLSMTKPQDPVTGYYSKIAEIPLISDPVSMVPRSDAQGRIRDFLRAGSLKNILCSPRTLLALSVFAFATWKVHKSWFHNRS